MPSSMESIEATADPTWSCEHFFRLTYDFSGVRYTPHSAMMVPKWSYYFSYCFWILLYLLIYKSWHNLDMNQIKCNVTVTTTSCSGPPILSSIETFVSLN